MVHERQDRGAIEQQALALAGVGHIGKLVRGNAQLLGENLPVPARLVEHIHEVGVLKDVLHLAGRKQVFDILRDAGGDAAPFSEPLPNLHRVGGGLFLFQQQVHLVDVVTGGFVGSTVDGNAVPHLVLDHQHTDLFQLLAQLLDVVADDTVVDVHIALMVKHIEGAGHIDFQRRGDVLRLFLVLRPQQVVEVLQDGHILRAGVIEIVLIHQPHTAVNDGFLNRLQALFAAYDQLAQRQDEVGLERQRTFIVRVVQVQIHRVNVIAAGGRNLDDLPMQALHQGRVLGLRVADNDVIIGEQETVGDLALGAEGLAGTRGAENQSIGVFQQLAVHHDEVVGQGVDTVVQRLFAVLEKLLGGERNKDSRGTGGQPPLNLDLIEAQGQRRHQPFFLLEVKPCQLAVVLLCDGTGLEHIVAQLPGIVRRVQHQEGHKEHSLVSALQILQELLGLGTVGGKVGGNDVHVISGADGFFLFLNFGFIQVGDFPLDRLDGLDLIYGLDMQADDQRAFHIQKIRQHPVIQLRGEDLQKRNSPVFFTHTELFAGAELEAGRRDEILGGQTGRSQPVPFKAERHLFIHVENAVKLCQPRLAVQGLGGHAQAFEVVENVGLNALQTGLGGLEAVGVDAESQVLGLDKTGVASCQLVLQHGGVLHPDAVKIIPLERNVDGAGKGLLRGCQVQKGQLELNGAVEVVEEIAPALEDRCLVLVLRELIVDVLELDGLCVAAACHTADAVRPHPFIGDTVLSRFFLFVCAIGTGNGSLDLLSVGAGQLFHLFLINRLRGLFVFSEQPVQPAFDYREQCHTPPCRVFPAVPKRHRSCWSDTGAPWAG